MQTIYFAADHAGFQLKGDLLSFVRDELGYAVEDCGAYDLQPDDDYPELIYRAAVKVADDTENARAIILGGSGQGEAIAANRLRGVRAAVYYGGDLEIVSLSREHNDANALALGARFLTIDEAKEAVRTWLATSFSQDARHVRRIHMLDAS